MAPRLRRTAAPRARLAAWLVAACVLLAGLPAAATTDADPVAPNQVKAAFLFNFAKFVQWPAEAGPLVVGVAGDEALATAVGKLVAGRTIDGRPIEVRALPRGRAAEGFHVLHVSSLLGDQDTAALLARVRGPVLTIGETPRFLRDGGMVRIFIEDQRLRFQVNRGQTDAAGVKISSQALSLSAK
jgi:hypothetical protein